MNKRRTRVLTGVLVAAMALTGVLVGTASADDEDPVRSRDTVLARVAELLGIDQDEVEDAFAQAIEEEREARRQRLQEERQARIDALIDEGVITEQQVEQWEEWLESKPDNSDEMREWFESRPDFDGEGFGWMPGGRGRLGGRHMMPGRPGGAMSGPLGGECPASQRPLEPDAAE